MYWRALLISVVAVLALTTAAAAQSSDPCAILNTRSTAAMIAACKSHEAALHDEVSRLTPAPAPVVTAQEIGWRAVQLAQADMTDTAMPDERILSEALRALKIQSLYGKVHSIPGSAWGNATWKAAFRSLTIDDVRTDGGLIQ